MSSFFNDIDLSNGDLWEVEHFEIVIAPLDPIYGRLAIADFDIPLFRRSRIMAARFFNPVARPWWKLGCFLNQSIAAPSSIDPSGSVNVTTWRIPLYHPVANKNQLVFFPDSSPRVWRLTASIPHWHQQAQVTIWRYTGALPNFLQTINNIETKVDRVIEILSSGNS